MKQFCHCVAALLAAATLSTHAGENSAADGKAGIFVQPGIVVMASGGAGPGSGAEMADAHALLLARIQPVVKGHPYSADEVDDLRRPLADGNELSTHRVTKVYRDQDGRTRREVEQPNGVLVVIADPVAQQYYALRPAQGSGLRLSGPMPPPLVPGAAAGAALAGAGAPLKYASQSNVTALGSRDIEGLAATGQSLRYEIPAGEMGNEHAMVVTTEIWYAPDLNIAVLNKLTDPRIGEHTRRVADVRQQEPSPSLFTVPSEYSLRDIPDASTKQP